MKARSRTVKKGHLPGPYKCQGQNGTMTHVRNLSGYVTTKNGELLAFSFLCNNYNVPRNVIDNLYDRMLAKLAAFDCPILVDKCRAFLDNDFLHE